ncbi:MAG: glycosyltransferase family 2 protein [Candidatus Bathyarchaeia archaeon]
MPEGPRADRAYSALGSGRPPKVSVLILNYNGLKWLPACLSSALRTDYPNLEIWLVDNGSSDGSIEYVRGNFPSVGIMANGRNLGFAEGYNRAIRAIDAEFVALLNTDTEVLEPGWIGNLVRAALEDPSAAAVACKLVSMEDPARLDSVGGMGIPFWRGFVDIGRGEPDRGQYDGPGFEPFAFCGGAALIRRDAFLRAGGFDGKFFLYAEDADLSWRLRLLGHRIAYAPMAKVAHYFSGTAGQRAISPEKLYYCHRNLLRAILKNCGRSLAWALRNCLLFSLLMIAGFAILEPKKALAALRALLWNLANFRDTWAWRLRIQAGRRVGEWEILRLMYPGLRRYRPPERAGLRRVLDILFEHSQLATLNPGRWRG